MEEPIEFEEVHSALYRPEDGLRLDGVTTDGEEITLIFPKEAAEYIQERIEAGQF